MFGGETAVARENRLWLTCAGGKRPLFHQSHMLSHLSHDDELSFSSSYRKVKKSLHTAKGDENVNLL